MKVSLNNLYITGLILIGIAGIVISGAFADSSTGETTNPFLPPLDPDNLPASAGGISMGSSSSLIGLSENSAPETSTLKNVVITENRLTLRKGQSGTHMVSFKNEGTVTVKSLSGTGIEVFSKNGGDWPENVTFHSDYGKSDLVTASEPLTLPITPGTWYFTILPLGEESTYGMIAHQMEGVTTTGTGSAPVGSFSSSMGAASFSFG